MRNPHHNKILRYKGVEAQEERKKELLEESERNLKYRENNSAKKRGTFDVSRRQEYFFDKVVLADALQKENRNVNHEVIQLD